MASGWVGFKFTTSAGWGTQYGMEDVSYEECNEDFLNIIKVKDKTTLTGPTSNRSNVEFADGAATAGTYHIEYRPFNFESVEVEGGAGTLSKKFTIKFTPAAQ